MCGKQCHFDSTEVPQNPTEIVAGEPGSVHFHSNHSSAVRHVFAHCFASFAFARALPIRLESCLTVQFIEEAYVWLYLIIYSVPFKLLFVCVTFA